MGVILFIVAIILTAPLFVLNLLIAPIIDIVTFNWKGGLHNLDRWFLSMAISIDQFGNASCARLFNRVFINKRGYQFGNIDQTVSFVLGVNLIRGNLTKLGKFIVWVLNIIEKDHCLKAFWVQYDHDCEALLRLDQNFYGNG